MFTKTMQKALEADGKKLRQLTNKSHGPIFIKNMPCKNEGNSEVASDGSCLRCGADQGEICRKG